MNSNNKTTSEVKRLREQLQDGIEIYLDMNTSIAIFEKYKRMEEVIYRETHLAAAAGDECRLARMQAALDFDPLTTS